jgi:hypothetical protein
LGLDPPHLQGKKRHVNLQTDILYASSRRCNPEHQHRHLHCRENFNIFVSVCFSLRSSGCTINTGREGSSQEAEPDLKRPQWFRNQMAVSLNKGHGALFATDPTEEERALLLYSAPPHVGSTATLPATSLPMLWEQRTALSRGNCISKRLNPSTQKSFLQNSASASNERIMEHNGLSVRMFHHQSY